ncbi:MAG TPA: nickel-dependent lactate racemase [Syntrophomonas sp.]|nr:nickel-dependent lactate racemase [Syntrophomonas sp.]
MADNYTTVNIPVGDTQIKAAIPNVQAVIGPAHIPGVKDMRAEVRRAIENPIDSPRLRDIAKGKKNAGIIVNDITRPYPGGLLVEEIAYELSQAGFTDDQIFLVVAYGNHRSNTHEELCSMFGEQVVERFRIVHHCATDESKLVTMGRTAGGVEVQINKEFAEAEVKITTGCITPHQLAGYSGGRKSVIPGIAGINSLKAHHSFPIRPKASSMGWLKGNPFHEEALAGAYVAGVDFIVNSVDNPERELVGCVAGELNAAHLKGVELCAKIWTVPVAGKADVVVVSPGGYPRDFDLHQAQKAIGCAEMLCKEGGQIILVAEARDGAGKFGKVLVEAKDPQDIIDKFTKDGYAPDNISKAYMWARAVQHFKIAVACSKISKEELNSMFLEGFDTVEEAIALALQRYGEDAAFLVIPHASDTTPIIG